MPYPIYLKKHFSKHPGSLCHLADHRVVLACSSLP